MATVAAPALFDSTIAPLSDYVAGTKAGQAITGLLGNPYFNAAVEAGFAGHGLDHIINEGVDGWGDAAMTALEVAPLGRLAKPVWNVTKNNIGAFYNNLTMDLTSSTAPSIIRLYHGSPVRFDKFDAQYIGSGEGGSKVMRGINLWPEEKIGNAPKFANIKSPDAPLHLGVSSTQLEGELNPTVYDVSGRGLKLYKASPREVKRLSQSDLVSQGYDGIQTPNQVTVFPESIGKLSIDKQSSIEDFIMNHPEVERWASWTTDNQKMQNIIDRSRMSIKSTPQITAENAASITPEQWTAAQDAAIARGDMAEAQRLRDLHFKVSAPNTVASVNGQPLQLYHGTSATFNAFDISKYGSTDGGTFGRGVYTTPVKEYAELYGENNMPLYMKLDNPRDYRNSSIGDLMAEKLAFGDDFATGIGIDGVIGRPSWKGFKGLVEYVSHNPENIKSSKAVTYDNNGVRIPLGERDNFGVNDIRYGLLPIVGMGALKALDKDGQIGFIDFNIGYQKGKDKHLQPPKFQKGTDDNRVQVTERTYPDGSVRYFTGDVELEPINTMDTDDMSMWTWQEKNRPYITYSGLGAKRNTEEVRQGKNKTTKDKILEFSNKHYTDPILGALARWRESWNNDTNPVKAIVDSGIVYGTPYGPAQGIYDLVKSAEAVKTGKGSFLDYLMAVPAVTAINDARKGLRMYKNATNTTLPDFSGWDIERIQAYLNSHPESIYSHKLGSLIDYSREGASDIKYAEDRASNFLKNDVYPRFVANTKRPITEEDRALFGANGLPKDVNASYTNLNGYNYGGWYNDNSVVINQAKDSPDNILTHELEHAQRDRLNTYGLLNDFDFTDSYVNGYTPSEIRALNNAYNFGDDFTYKLGNIGSINEKGATNRELRYAISSDYGETGKALDDIIDKMSIEDLKQYLNTTNAYSKDFLKNAGSDFYKNVKEALKYVPATVGLTVATDSYNKGKDIYIKPSKRGTFTAAAKKRGMSVQQFASKVLKAPKGKYSTSMRKKANFAKNASKWKK